MIKRGSDFRPWLGNYEVFISNHLSPLNVSLTPTHPLLFSPSATPESLLAGYMRFGPLRNSFASEIFGCRSGPEVVIPHSAHGIQ